jgi:Ca-activated chloride channel family protein
MLLAGFAASADDGAVRPVASDLVEYAGVRLVRLPVLLEDRSPGGCDAVRASSVEVLEDGLPLQATRLEPTRMPTIHAVMIDSSRRMLDVLQESKAAARHYIAALPPGEAALLASFDDSLILHTPLTPDRRRLGRDLTWIETGWGSNLWDATQQMTRYLRSLPQRKVLVLLTDGCDSDMSGTASATDVIELAAQTPSLIVFPVGIAVPRVCDYEPDQDPVAPLKRLARRTGGRYARLDSAERLDSILDAVRARIDRERYVSYRPPPFGEGPEDRPDEQSYRWRKLKIRFRERAACRISLAGPPTRFEGDPCEFYAADARIEKRTLTAPLALDPEAAVIRGAIRDVVRDSGPLLGTELEMLDHYGGSGERRTAARNIAVDVPPLERVVRSSARPADALLRALSTAASSPDAAASHWSDVPFLANGRSLLDLRTALARELARQPAYATWARGKARERRLAALDELVQAGGDAVQPEIVSGLRELLRGDDWEQSWFAGQLLEARRAGADEEASRIAQRAERVWPSLRTWLPRPRDARVLGWLSPAYDPVTDRVGFYRVVLPRPQSFLGAWDFSFEGPLGVRFLHWILQQEAASGILTDHFVLDRVSYRHLFSQHLLRLLRTETLASMGELGEDWEPGRIVSLLFEPKAPFQSAVAVHAYYSEARNPDGPDSIERFCILRQERTVGEGLGRGLLDAMVAAKRTAPVPCVLQLRER